MRKGNIDDRNGMSREIKVITGKRKKHPLMES